MTGSVRHAALVAILALAQVTWLAGAAHAQPEPSAPSPPAPTPDEELERARALFGRGQFTEAREVLLRAYQQQPSPALLFALGQVELNLGHPAEAIAYYEKFIATGPSEDELSLAQQAIGAAQMQLSLRASPTPPPSPPPPPPPPRRRPPRWDSNGTRLVLLGGIGIAAAAGLFVYGGRLADDQTGTLAEYDAQVDRARLWRWIGVGVGAAGVLTIGAAIVRWRTSGGLEVSAAPRAGGVAVSLERRW
jgi:tetratricopeptide (TPR) repeat protein